MVLPRKRIKEERVTPESDEVFSFSISEDGLTAKQCFELYSSFHGRLDFFNKIPQDERNRFLTTCLKYSKAKNSLKCLMCPKTFVTGNGLNGHLNKCDGVTKVSSGGRRSKIEAVDPETTTLPDYQKNPFLWLNVPENKKTETISRILRKPFECFGENCSKSFDTATKLVKHLNSCIQPMYYNYKSKIDEFRGLTPDERRKLIRDAIAYSKTGEVPCLDCDRLFAHAYGLQYHVDRCNIDKDEQPWKCYRCGFVGKGGESAEHLLECAEKLVQNKKDSLPQEAASAGNKVGPSPRTSVNRHGTVKYSYRRSVLSRDSTMRPNKIEQRKYEEACKAAMAKWRSARVEYCEILANLQPAIWTATQLPEGSSFREILRRKSVTICKQKTKKLMSRVPDGIRIDALKSQLIDEPTSSGYCTAAYCGAPINSVKVAPNAMPNGDEVICCTTFESETRFESDSSIVHFWRHRIDDRSQLIYWFSLFLENRGTVMHSVWLNIPDDSGIIGYLALSTTLGQVLIYRIDSSTVELENRGDGTRIVTAEPHLILNQPEVSLDGLDSAAVEEEKENETIIERLAIGRPPITKISWSAETNGAYLVAVNACGALVLWDLRKSLENPTIHVDPSWASPAWDVAFLDGNSVAVGFRERMVRVINIVDFVSGIEENTNKTAGSRVFCEPRLFKGLFTFQSEYNSFPAPNSMGISFISIMDGEERYVLIPLMNCHQLMIWDIAVQLNTGYVVTVGVDGQIQASQFGKLPIIGETLAANCNLHRNLMILTRKRVENEPMVVGIKQEICEEAGDEPPTAAIEPTCFEHDSVCSNMWLEIEFEQLSRYQTPQTCRDQRIESLNCVDTSISSKIPTIFAGGEAGILFALPCEFKKRKQGNAIKMEV
ncbi:unnamed protein product [Caenorhabditis bovis]|uniref:Uncharacterized protein n=1 Tax=Caenorhabditis bovis TaxID=2654633 RepID=A0A8S1F143_9PELO|nr:unnamed protein product [Caenorhabditis bovis]